MTIKEIKAQLAITTVLAHYNITINKNKHCLCPFHEDKTPSLKIYPETNTYHCFGCGKTGDTIQFIQDKQGLTKHKALIKAKELIGHTISVKPSDTKSTVAVVNYQGVFKTLQQKLHTNKKAVAYLQDRMLYDAKLEYGYKPQGTNALYKGMNSCIIFPLKNAQDKIVSFYGRSITNKGKHYYATNRQGLYPNYPSQETQTLVLTESVIDATTLLKYTDYTVLALYGTNGLTQEHSEALIQLTQLEEVTFFLDGDESGRNAVSKHSQTLHELLPNVTISDVATPDNEDVNSLVQSHEPEILQHLIQERKPIFLIEEKAPTDKNPIPDTRQLDTSNPDYLTLNHELLKITVLGGINLIAVDKLKVTLRIERNDPSTGSGMQNPLYHIRQSNLDLYNDEQLEKFIRKVAERLELGTREVQHTLYTLINGLEDYRKQQNQANKEEETPPKILTPQRKQKLIKFLKAPNLLQRTNDLIGKTGMIGETNNRLLMYLVFTSRLREQPLHIISLGASGTGKTYLQEKISQLIPTHHKLEITALSENALYYFDRTELKNKLVLIEDLDGAQDDKILYAIRELMSKKRISKTIPIKDAKGNLKTITLQVEGPICLAGTTTKEKIYEDNANRSLLIYLDNSKAQKDAIMQYQQALSAGLVNKKEEQNAIEFLQDVQTLLKSVKVRNPYATQLNIPETVFKPLRTNTHYLAFIETITFYNQYQRSVSTDKQIGQQYITTTLEDIQQANTLLKDVLLTKSDELTKACRNFLEVLKAHLQSNNKPSFYSSELRKTLRINPKTLSRYLYDLQRYNHLRIVSGSKARGYEYELIDSKEYQTLQNSIQNALDTALDSITESQKTTSVPQ